MKMKLYELLENSVLQHSKAASFRFIQESGCQSILNSDLLAQAKEISLLLQKIGVHPKDRIVILGENSLLWMICYLGILWAGGVAVPLDTELLPDSTNILIEKMDPILIFCSPRQIEKVKMKAVSPVPIIEMQQFEKMKSVLGSHNRLARKESFNDSEYDENIASIVNSSGTGGKMKGILLSHESIIDAINYYRDAFVANNVQNLLCVLPCFAIYPCVFSFAAFSSGKAIYFADPRKLDLVKIMQQYPVDCIPLVPLGISKMHEKIIDHVSKKGQFTRSVFTNLTQFSGLLRNKFGLNIGKFLFPSIHKAFGSNLKSLLTGGANLNPKITKDFFGWGFTVVEGYGLTETAGVVAATNGEFESIGTCGKAIDGFTITIDQPDQTGSGEVLIKGPRIMSGYFREPEANLQCWKDGAFRTGDLGKIDGNGNLLIVGRIKEIIVHSDERKTLPQDVEQRYQNLEGVERLAIVGIQNTATKNDNIHAAVVPEKLLLQKYDGDLAEVKKHIEKQVFQRASELPSYLRISQITLFDTLPTNSLGKIIRAEIKARIIAKAGSG